MYCIPSRIGKVTFKLKKVQHLNFETFNFFQLKLFNFLKVFNFNFFNFSTQKVDVFHQPKFK